MATYREIQQWVREQYGSTPKGCWIAHCKELCGLRPRRAANRRGEKRVHPCPPEKRAAIKAAFQHFHMLPPELPASSQVPETRATEPTKDAALTWGEKVRTVVRAFLAGLPYAGALAQGWSDWTTGKRFARIEHFFRDMDDHLRSVGQRVRHSEKQIEEFPALIEEVVKRVQREPREEKITWLRAFLAGAILDAEGWDLSKRLFFLRVLDTLGKGEMFLLSLFAQRDSMRLRKGALGQTEYGTLMNDCWVPIQIPIPWAQVYLRNLCNAGLVREQIAGGRRDSGVIDIRDSHWVLDSVGREFLQSFAFAGGKPDCPPP